MFGLTSNDMTESGGEIVTSSVAWDTLESSSESLSPPHSISAPGWVCTKRDLSDSQEVLPHGHHSPNNQMEKARPLEASDPQEHNIALLVSWE